MLEREDWDFVRLPAVAEDHEKHIIVSPYRTQTVVRRKGEALHPDREPLEVLEHLRRTMGEYNFAGHYQQEPAPLGGALVKTDWFRAYTPGEEPAKFDRIIQSWDTADKSTELSDYSVCTTWGQKNKRIYLLHVLRKRIDYPELKSAVREQADLFSTTNILIEDKASGTQLIQELIREGAYGVTRYEPTMEKIMRLHSVTNTIENGFVYVPEEADWLALYLHELTTFPYGKHDDQADSTSQALDWIKQTTLRLGFIEYLQQQELRQKLGLSSEYEFVEWDEEEEIIARHKVTKNISRWTGNNWVDDEQQPAQQTSCPACQSVAVGTYGKMHHCHQCGKDWPV